MIKACDYNAKPKIQKLIKKGIKITTIPQSMSLYTFGFRELSPQYNKQNITYSVKINNKFELLKGESNGDNASKQNLSNITNHNFHKYDLIIDVPAIESMCPVMEVYIYDTSFTNSKKLIGVAQ